MKATENRFKKIGEMTETELKALCAFGFELATGCKCALKNVVLCESDNYTVWYRIGCLYFYISSFSHDDGFAKYYYLSDDHKAIKEQFS